jgi:multicomponent Na+:H+ antiporter subunit E
MKLYLMNVILAFLWAALTANFTIENIVLGFCLSFIVIALISRIWGKTPYAAKAWLLTSFACYIIWELFVSSIKVAMDVLRPTLRNKPGVIAIPLETENDIETTVLANLISLTPGTLTLDVSSDMKTLFLHTMYADDIDGVRRSIKKNLEQRILGIMA